ncbi:unnamed protein product [Closterium sp. Naga37s-1]|nr:unnamed protein product [Closterium sp. Naga37s-1]
MESHETEESNKETEESNKEVTRLMESHEVEQQLRLIGQRIRSTLDRGVIISTALLELRDLLNLENAALWLPAPNGRSLELTNECEHRVNPILTLVPLKDKVVSQVIANRAAMVIPSSCQLVECSALPPPLGSGRTIEGGKAACCLLCTAPRGW